MLSVTSKVRDLISIKTLLVIILLISLFAAILWLLTGPLSNESYNADALTFPALYKDIFIDRTPFKWRFSSQLFVFPDFIIYALSNTFLRNFRYALIANGLISFSLFIFILYQLYKQIGLVLVKKNLGYFAFAAGILVCLFAQREYVPFLIYIFVPGVYFGSILASLTILFFVIKLLINSEKRLSDKNQKIIYSAVGIVTTLSVFTNPLILVQFIAPLIGTLCIGYLIDMYKLKKVAILSSFILASCALGFTLRYLADNYLAASVGGYIRPEAIAKAIAEFIIYGKVIYHSEQLLFFALQILLYLVVVAFYIFFIGSWCRKIRTTKESETSDQLLHLILGFTVLSTAVNLVVIVGSGNYASRYFYPGILYTLTFLPVVALALHHWAFIKDYEKVSKYLFVLIGIASLLISAVNFRNVNKLSAALEYYPEYIECIDSFTKEKDFKSGVSEYWEARHTTLLSHNDLKIIPVNKDFIYYWWLSNASEQDNFSPQFIIINPRNNILQISDVEMHIGKDYKVEKCEHLELLYFEKESESAKILEGIFKAE